MIIDIRRLMDTPLLTHKLVDCWWVCPSIRVSIVVSERRCPATPQSCNATMAVRKNSGRWISRRLEAPVFWPVRSTCTTSEFEEPQISESKMWSSVLRDLHPRKTVLSRPSSNCTYKLQIRYLVGEVAPHQLTRNSLKVIKKKKLFTGPIWVPDKIDWPANHLS
jgi:hypothetical protein